MPSKSVWERRYERRTISVRLSVLVSICDLYSSFYGCDHHLFCKADWADGLMDLIEPFSFHMLALYSLDTDDRRVTSHD